MRPYADTNFLLRLYLSYAETDAALARVKAMRRGSLPICWLHQIEFTNALQLIRFQARAGGTPFLTPEAAAVALHDFKHDVVSGAQLADTALSAAELVRACEQLSARHTASFGCRTYDLVHVAAALHLKCDTFLSFDAKATKLAELEGMKVM